MNKIPEFSSAKNISKKLLKSVWKRISDKPFPDVLAFTFGDNDFLLILSLLQKNHEVTDTRVKEYGVDFPNKYVEACTFEFKNHIIIFIKQNAPLIDSLEHELRQINSGDFALRNKP